MKKLVYSSLLIAFSAHALPIYHSIGEHGEARYSQFPPQGQYRVLNFHQYAHAPKAASSDKQKQCQILRDNLVALNAGGVIHEIDASGNQKELTAQEVELRKTQTQTALKEHCQS